MRDIIDELCGWLEQGKRIALAIVVGVNGSAPREPGTALAVSDDGSVIGSVSGGCLEQAVYQEAQDAIRTRRPKKLTFGISDDDAFEVGLTCGGTIEVVVVPVDDDVATAIAAFRSALEGERSVTITIIVEGEHLGALTVDGAEHTSSPPGRRDRNRGGARVFIDRHLPPPAMYVFGATDVAARVVTMGRFLNYRVTVCDARAIFATRERFPDADEVIVRWPHEFLREAPVDDRTVICCLTHDTKYDVPAIEMALRTPALYIGAIGSRRTHEQRRFALIAAGVPEAALDRVAGPIGLDIGSVTPEEVSVSIAAEIISVRHRAPGGRLSERDGPIHRSRGVSIG